MAAFMASEDILDLTRGSRSLVMKNTLAAIILVGFSFTFSSGVAAQTKSLQRMQAVMGPTGRTDLNSTLIELERVSQATQDDIANLHVENWKSGWKTGFLKDGSHKEQAQHAAGSLRRNLSAALPGLIHDVQTSRGGISASFKLYDDVTLLCETLDSLITASERAGKKNDAAPLGEDYSALARVRRSLATYIQQSAATWETRGKLPAVSFAAPATQPSRQMSSSSPQIVTTDQGVKKIIIDDTVPEKKPAAPAKKKADVTYSNLE
jgi:hypothetical protein